MDIYIQTVILRSLINYWEFDLTKHQLKTKTLHQKKQFTVQYLRKDLETNNAITMQ